MIDAVVKVGGGLLSFPESLSAVLTVVANAARAQRLLLVPGGGPFADAVRDVDSRIGLGDDAAHWMAVLAMNQYAHLIAAKLGPSAALAEDLIDVSRTLAAGRLPVLLPYRWMRAADPLPHAWEVTSDSIAAWIAGVSGAGRLVLVKPPIQNGWQDQHGDRRAADRHLVDAYFDRALAARVAPAIVTADRLDLLRGALRAGSACA
jgi:aspartokinase-like uncharacterized kinase